MHRLEESSEMSLKDEVFARLEKVANYANLSPAEQGAYEANIRWISEYDKEMATGRREARAEGLAEGRDFSKKFCSILHFFYFYRVFTLILPNDENTV